MFFYLHREREQYLGTFLLYLTLHKAFSLTGGSEERDSVSSSIVFVHTSGVQIPFPTTYSPKPFNRSSKRRRKEVVSDEDLVSIIDKYLL